MNVIFSRAKKHMAVVSSIKYHHITNEYNEGANYFRRFLQYSENVSAGNMQMARTILDSLVVNKKDISSIAAGTIVMHQLKQHLQQQGYDVMEQVGQSDFKCSLAVKLNKDDEDYSLGILIDDEKHYGNHNLLEQYYQRPDILRNFGWRVIHVFAKDWLQQPQKVLEQVIKRIKEEPQTEEDVTIPEVISQPIPLSVETPEPPPTSSLTGYDHLQFDRLVFAEGNSNKFWEIAVDGVKLIVRFGRVGTKGQVQLKSFADEAAAVKEKEKMVREKINKGYRS